MLKLFQLQTASDPHAKGVGSIMFFRLRPTCRVTEFITFVFGPVFVGGLGSAIGVWGIIVGAIIGFTLAWFAIYIRRYCEGWALDANKKFEKYFADNAFEDRKFIGPHPSLPHVTETLMMTGEVLVLCIISTFFLAYLYFNDIAILHAFINALQPYVSDFFSAYSGLDHEIKMHAQSQYSGRIIIMKIAAFFIFIACTYGCVVMSIRMLHGWREYWRILNIIQDSIIIKKESIVLLTLILSAPGILIGIDNVFYQGFEFYLIMDKVPGDEWYVLFGLTKFILMVFGFTMFVFLQLSVLLSYFVVLIFYYVYIRMYSRFGSV